MKHFIKGFFIAFIVQLIIVGIAYLICSFIQLDFKIIDWKTARILLSFLTLFSFFSGIVNRSFEIDLED